LFVNETVLSACNLHSKYGDNLTNTSDTNRILVRLILVFEADKDPFHAPNGLSQLGFNVLLFFHHGCIY
jgi:hypothetical protein